MAFLFSAEKLFRENKHVYFWTFTFKDCISDWAANYAWNGFITELRNYMYSCEKVLYGLKVTESFNHGLHFHVLLNHRIGVASVRRIGRKYGFGRVHVVKCDEGAAGYMAKYLTKDNDLLKGARRWGTIGGFRQSRVRNIEVDSILHRNIRKAGKGKQLDFIVVQDICRKSLLYGDSVNWPENEPREVIKRSDLETSRFSENYYLTKNGKSVKLIFERMRKSSNIDQSSSPAGNAALPSTADGGDCSAPF
jgi:hypothetical protein